MLPALPCDIDGRYTLIAELGHGSHAIVYRALDRDLDREVAVKVLRQELLGSGVSDRFQREIRFTSRLDHPNIAHVYGTGEYMGSPYFVIALARGASLRERLEREHQLPVHEALAIATQVASALQHAHGAGIIHRDVKPENILLTNDGALLSDFGVARALEGAAGTLATTTGVAVGTLLYMSPEQLCAERDIDARSDQYALALVLYEMLAGVPAHVAASAEGLRGLRIVGQHAPVRTHRPAVPEQVEDALQQALAPAPADRYTSMAAFITALDGRQSSSSIRTRATIGAARSSALAPRGRRFAVGAIGLLAVVAAGALGAHRFRRPVSAAVVLPEGLPTRFTVLADGDTAVAHALARELGLWSPDIRVGLAASPDDAAAVMLETRATSLEGGVRVAVQLRTARAATASARVVQITLPAATAARADSMRVLAARVLLASQVSPDSVELPSVVVERPLEALRRYAAGWALLLAGDLPQAEQAFADAARSGSLPQAALWQTTVASWRQPRTPSAWRDAAALAQSVSVLLSPRDSLLAEALLHRARDRMPESCAAYTRATRVAGGSFAAWYGLGECLRLDSIVVLDAASPTGARFRTSRWGAGTAYEEAIARLPAIGLVPLFARLPAITLALNGTKRSGALGTATGPTYGGLPSVAGDSVAVFPERFSGADARASIPPSYQPAVRLLRRRLLAMGAALARRAPGSLGAHIAYASALEVNGAFDGPSDSTAVAVLRRALPLALTSQDTLDVAIAEVRIRLRLGDFAGVHAVVAPMLATVGTHRPDDAHRLIPLAVLTGRAAVAESLLVRDLQQPGPGLADGARMPIASAVARYTIASASGDCSALERLRAQSLDAMRNSFAQTEVATVARSLLQEGDWMRLACVGAPLPDGVTAGDALLRATDALRRNDLPRARARLRDMRRGRDGASASAVAWDTRFVETWMLAQVGDSASAYDGIVAALDDLAATMDYVLRDVPQAAGFRRSLMLCDSLATARRDTAMAARCHDAVNMLSGRR